MKLSAKDELMQELAMIDNAWLDALVDAVIRRAECEYFDDTSSSHWKQARDDIWTALDGLGIEAGDTEAALRRLAS